MAGKSIVHVSLAWKCRLLFGLAVLVIMAVALLMPFQRMDMLVDGLNHRTARQIALAVLLRPEVQQQEWAAAQEKMADWWPAYAKRLEVPAAEPTIEGISCAEVAAENWPAGFGEFHRQALRQMCPGAAEGDKRAVDEFYWAHHTVGGRPEYRYARAIRSVGQENASPAALAGAIFVTLPAAALVEQPFWNRIVITAAGGSAGVAAILVFYLITQLLILSPVRKLRRVADQVSAGDLSVRARLATGDEFEQLGEAFNRMLENLHVSQEELRTINKSLDVKLGELAEANVALFEADRLKSEFLTNVTHELRTPLSSIIGFAELLNEAFETVPSHSSGDHDARQARLARYSMNILSSARMLLDIINDLLDLAKIEAGQMEVHRRPVIVRDICESLADLTRPLRDKKGLTLELRLPEDLPVLNSDAGKIQQILYNLLSNAIKFSPPEGTITLAAELGADEQIHVSLSDTGPGIPEDQQATVFDKFRQLDGSVTREHSGTGLGLAISRELARMLGGSVTVASVPGQGATFTVILPVEAPVRTERTPLPLTMMPARVQ